MTDEKENKDSNSEEKSKPEEQPEKPPVQTQHELTMNGSTLKYTVTAGMMPLKDAATGKKDADIFFTAYTVNGVNDYSERPLVFVFNGGPGSASVWLHMGAVGPKRVRMEDEGWMPAPPFKLVVNDSTWLDIADLVFIDPVGTGFSRLAKDDDKKEGDKKDAKPAEDKGKKFWSVKGDLDSVTEFIRLYITRYNRWISPLFLAGESYGSTRAAGLSKTLFDKGIALNGIILISTVLQFQSLIFAPGNDLSPYVYIPTYAATAWYHKRLPKDLQSKPLEEVLAEVEAWTENEYSVALAKGDTLSADERKKVAAQLTRYTGLKEDYIEDSNLRVHIWRYCNELLRHEKKTVGRIDSRFKSPKKMTGISEFPEFDPSISDIDPPYTAMFNTYVRNELGYETDEEYKTLSYEVNEKWEWDRFGYPDTSDMLRQAFERNPHMQVMVAQGYYDLATPHFAARHTFNHMDLPPELRDNVNTTYYEAGHMFYLETKSLAKFKEDVVAFFSRALGR